jgi:hypothetical protein
MIEKIKLNKLSPFVKECLLFRFSAGTHSSKSFDRMKI